MPMGMPRHTDLIELASGSTRGRVAPLAGGSIAAYYDEAPDCPQD